MDSEAPGFEPNAELGVKCGLISLKTNTVVIFTGYDLFNRFFGSVRRPL